MKTRIVRYIAIVFTLAAIGYMAVSTGQARSAYAADSGSQSGDQSSGSGDQSGSGAAPSGGCCG